MSSVGFRLTSSVTSSLTQPAGSQLPLVEEDEFSFAVVNGSFSVEFGDIGQLTDALWSLHPNPEQQLTEMLWWPAADITFCPDEVTHIQREEEEETGWSIQRVLPSPSAEHQQLSILQEPWTPQVAPPTSNTAPPTPTIHLTSQSVVHQASDGLWLSERRKQWKGHRHRKSWIYGEQTWFRFKVLQLCNHTLTIQVFRDTQTPTL